MRRLIGVLMLSAWLSVALPARGCDEARGAQSTGSNDQALEVAADSHCYSDSPTRLDTEMESWTAKYHEALVPVSLSVVAIRQEGISRRSCNRLVANSRNAAKIVRNVPDPDIDLRMVEALGNLEADAKSCADGELLGSGQYIRGLNGICHIQQLLEQRYYCPGISAFLQVGSELDENCRAYLEEISDVREYIVWEVVDMDSPDAPKMEEEFCEDLLKEAESLFVGLALPDEVGLMPDFAAWIAEDTRGINCSYKDYKAGGHQGVYGQFKLLDVVESLDKASELVQSRCDLSYCTSGNTEF